MNTGLNWTTVTTDKLAGMAAIVKQEQQCVAVGPGNGHFIFVRQVSSDAAMMQRGICGHMAVAHATMLLRRRPLLLCVYKLVI